MKRRKIWAYILFILLTQAVGALSGFLSRDGMASVGELPQSALTPPAPVFPIVWTLLYTLMAVGAARVYLTPENEERTQALGLYLLQLIFNFFWSLIYFNMRAFCVAFFWIIALWALILLMILAFRKLDKAAAWLQLPYLIWVTFAGYLNFVMWRMNG